MAELDTFKLRGGDPPPPFDLPGVDGRNHPLFEFTGGKLLLVVFSCNHCPYAQAWEGRLIDLAKEYALKGLATVVINPNDTENYPDDRFERMVERAQEKGYPFPYLRDDSQEVARAYGALVTPHPFLFSKTGLAYQGKIDDAPKDTRKVRHRYLKEAIDALLAGRPVVTPSTSVVGCSVKWRTDEEPFCQHAQ